MINNHRLKYVNKFTYLGNIIRRRHQSTIGKSQVSICKSTAAMEILSILPKDLNQNLPEQCPLSAPLRLRVLAQDTTYTRAMSSLCSSTAQSAGAGHNIHQSNVLSLLLYGSECWRRTQHTPEQCPLSAPLRLRVLAQDTTYTRAMSSLCSSTAQRAGAGHNIHQSNVLSLLLYGSEGWRVTQKETNRLFSFHNTCLRKILKVYWPETISNTRLHQATKQQHICLILKREGGYGLVTCTG